MTHLTSETMPVAATLWTQTGPRRARPARGRAVLPNLLAIVIVAMGLFAYLEGQPLLVWAALPAGLWLAMQSPEKLVGLLLLTTPMFPVIRVVQDRLGAQQVSTRGLYFTLDDPLILSLLVAAVLRGGTALGRRMEWFPTALLGLAAYYPLVIAANVVRLEPDQSLLSLLYYLKWFQYASLLLVIPGALPPGAAPAMLRILRRCLTLALVASATFALYEVAEALRTGSYGSAGLFPRASSFFGTLDPLRFGASEDPVNFGVFMMIGGSIALSALTQSRQGHWYTRIAAAAAAAAGVALSASRTPLLAAMAAYTRLRRVSIGQTVLLLVAVLVLAFSLQLFFPDLWATTWVRFESLVFDDMAIDGSASGRLSIMMNAPVFEIDSHWFTGHGHSSYRFVAEQHLSRFTTGISRSLYNFPLTIWYDAGFFGLLLWGLFYFQLRARLRRISRQGQSGELRTLAMGLSAGLSGLAVASLFGEFPYNWRIMGFFYSCCGACLACDRAARWMAEGAGQ
jgi:hypothetical protein